MNDSDWINNEEEIVRLALLRRRTFFRNVLAAISGVLAEGEELDVGPMVYILKLAESEAKMELESVRRAGIADDYDEPED